MPFVLRECSNYTEQIPHKAARKFDSATIYCWRHVAKDATGLRNDVQLFPLVKRVSF